MPTSKNFTDKNGKETAISFNIDTFFNDSYVGFASPATDLSAEDKANIIMLRSLPQFESFRRFLVMSARDFYRQAGLKEDEKESRMNARLGVYIEDLIAAIEGLTTKEPEQDNTDAYDMDTEEQIPQGMTDDIITAQP